MRLRQIALVADDLDARTDELCSVLGLRVAYRDPEVGKWGLHNIVTPVGGNFLEIVAPKEPNTAAGRYLKRRGGDGGYMVILQCADAVAERARIKALGVRTVHESNRPAYQGTHFHPQDTGGALLSVDSVEPGADHLAPLCSWEPAGPDWKSFVRTEWVNDLLAAELQDDEPEALARRWADILCHPVRADGAGWRMDMEQGHLRFVRARDGRPPGLGAIDFQAARPDAVLAAAKQLGLPVHGKQVVLCGIRINLV
ncbi:MAG: VOC family protein [Candidatus Lambdaproteobacteria bacterium]|nr:VOC family protein [Candidatus Lambdaproteobacteria bacterium]